MKCVALFLLIGTVTVMAQDPSPDPDPCNIAYTLVDEGWRSINCEMEYFGCDRYMPDGWYKVQDKSSQNYLQMPTSCVPSGRCGVNYPIWLNGSHPSVQDGVVNSTACVSSFHSCCRDTYHVRVKNCSNYMVYHLVRAHGCMERYCFGDSTTCNTTETINTSGSPVNNTTIKETTRTDTQTTTSLNILDAAPRPDARNNDIAANVVGPISDSESMTGVDLNSWTGESDPKLLVVIAVLSTLLVVVTVAVIIYIIMKMRARNRSGIYRKESSA